MPLEINAMFWFIAVSLAILWLIFKWLQAQKLLPPGPVGWPIVGLLPTLISDPHKVLVELGQRYGSFMSGHIFYTFGVAINDCDTAKQVLSHSTTFSRPSQFGEFLPGLAGFASFSGEKWHEERRFCVSLMRSLGMGKGEWETMIENEIEEFIVEIKSWNGKPKDFLETLDISIVSNFISLLIRRKTTNDQSKHAEKVSIDFVRLGMSYMAPSCYVLYLPGFVVKFLRWIGVVYVKQLLKSMEDFNDFLRTEIKKCASGASEKPTFVSYYLKEMETQKKINGSSNLSVDSLVGDISGLFLGGVDTIRVSLHWMILLLAAHPDIQSKVQAEIDAVAGRNRHIYWDERNSFPYTMATIYETERWVAVTPFYLPRDTMEPMKVGDHIIPKKTVIVTNWWAITRDEKYFQDADNFTPERFLNDEQTRLRKLDGFIPFSFGKRSCPGKHIGMMTLFLYITTLMQNFRVTPPEGKTVSFEDMGIGATRNAIPQEVCFIER